MELITILKSLKRPGDKALASRKKDLIELYHEWKDRPPLVFDYSAVDNFFSSLNNDDERNSNVNSTNNDDAVVEI